MNVWTNIYFLFVKVTLQKWTHRDILVVCIVQKSTTISRTIECVTKKHRAKESQQQCMACFVCYFFEKLL